MEQKHTCASICDCFPTLSANHPWCVQGLEDDGIDHIVYTMRDPPSQYRYRIPSSIGKHIRGCFHGWVILSNHTRKDMWSLWNPVTSKIIRLPRLIPKHCLNISQHCCLSSPPDDRGSVLMLPTFKHTIVFCRLDCKRKKFKWVEMSYAKQLKKTTGDDGLLFSLTCCNGKVYALNTGLRNFYAIHIDIAVKGKETVISLKPYMKVPVRHVNHYSSAFPFLLGCCTELFYVELGLTEAGQMTKQTVDCVCVFKLDMSFMRWFEMDDLKDAALFVDLAHDYSMFYSPSISSDLGGFVHYRLNSTNVIHSYNIKNRTVALSSIPTSHIASFSEECRLQQEDYKGNEMVVRNEETFGNSTRIVENRESRLLNIPFDVLKTIMKLCVGVEYLNFRATCKQCHFAAPMIQWSKGGRLQTYSLVSPWLMVVENSRGVIFFIDPMFGDQYFIKTPHEISGNVEIHCSMYGWLLIRNHHYTLMFFNPFTSDIRKLPLVPNLDTYCFSMPPTSSDCMVVGFTARSEWHVYIHFVAREQVWRRYHLNFCGDDSHSFHFATLYGRNLYALYNNGELGFIDTANNEDYTWRKVLAEGPGSSCRFPKQNFLTKRDQQLLLVIVREFGESVEVFKLNGSTEWEKIESLGRHVIFIGVKTCLCTEAKSPVMANRIYFPRVHSENRKIVFYSLETKQYHTSNMEESFGDFVGTEHHFNPQVWIEPSWS